MTSRAWVDLRSSIPGLRGRRVHVMASAEEPRVREALRQCGFRLHVVEGAAIRDPESLFDEFARVLSLSRFGRNWDALIDALGDLSEAGGTREAVLWRDVHRSLAADVQTVVEAAVVLDDSAADAAQVEAPDGRPVQIEVFLFGEGEAFR